MRKGVLVLTVVVGLMFLAQGFLGLYHEDVRGVSKIKTSNGWPVEACDSARASTGKIRLYLGGGGTNYYLDTIPTTASQPSNLILDSSSSTPQPETTTFNAKYAFSRDVEVFGDTLPDYTDRTGMWLHLPTNYVGLSGSGTVIVKIISDTGTSKTVATGEATVSPGNGENDYQLAFEEPADSYVFPAGATLKLEISVNVTGAGGVVRFAYNGTGDAGSAYLTLKTDFVEAGDIKGELYDWKGRISYSFQPNMPLVDHKGNKVRVIRFRGSVEDAFYQTDIKAVGVSVEDPNGAELFPYTPAEFSLNETNNLRVDYRYDWEYPQYLSYGEGYTAKVWVTDQSGNNYTKDMYFTITRYGVFIDSEEESYKVQPGVTSDVEIYVYNTGSQSDIITTEVSIKETHPDGAEWDVGLKGVSGSTSDEQTINRGVSHTYTISVISPSNSVNGDRCLLKVHSYSNKNSTMDYILEIDLVVVPKTEFVFNIVGDTSKTTSPGSTVEFQTSIKNIGDVADTYTIVLVTTIPTGWSADFYTSNPDSIGWTKNGTTKVRYDFNLSVAAKATVYFRVTTPSKSSSLASQSFEIAVSSHALPSNVKKREVVVILEGAVGDVISLETDVLTATVSSVTGGKIHYGPVSTQVLINNPTDINFTVSIEKIGVFDRMNNALSNWMVNITSSDTVAKGTLGRFDVEITPADDSPGDEEGGYKIKLRATIEDLSQSKDLTITVFIKRFENVSVVLKSGTNKTITSTEGTEFEFTITNKGNVATTVYITPSLEGANTMPWDVEIDPPSPISLEQGESVTLTLTVKADESTVEIGDDIHINVDVTYGESKKRAETQTLYVSYSPTATSALTKVTKDLSLHIILFIILLIYALIVGRKISS